jgi:CheY-like chemotaxis protein
VRRSKQTKTEAIPGQNEQLMLVEDDPVLRSLLERMLKDFDYRVTAFPNGSEALNAIQRKDLEPILLVTDMVMPGMSGVVLAERLRQSQPNVKVLFITGHTDDAISKRDVLDPQAPFLAKPFSADELASKIREVLHP